MLISETLIRLGAQRAVPSDQCAVLMCPPLSRRSWRQGGRNSDFAQEVLRLNGWGDWAAYEDGVALPVLAELMEIRESSRATIRLDIGFFDFREILRAGRYSLVFLVAHRPGTLERPSIEFRDQVVAWPDIEAAFADIGGRESLSFILITCNGLPFAKSLRENQNISVGGSLAEISLLDVTRFIRIWVAQLDGFLTVEQSYQRAVKGYLKI